MKSVGKPDAGNPHVRFDERGTGNGAIGQASSHRALPRLYNCDPGLPEQLAAIVAWCVSSESALMTGQILFVDGSFECLARGERSWRASLTFD